MRRIALVTPILPVPFDPTRGRYIHETARALSSLATVRVYYLQPRYPRLPGLAPRSFLDGLVGPDFSLPGIEVEALGYPALPGLSRITNGLLAARALAAPVARFRPDLLLGYWLYPDGAAAQRVARKLGVPCVVGARGSDIHVRHGVSRRLTAGVVARADALLTVSRAMRAAAIADYGADPARCHAIANGFDTGVFHPRDRATARAALALDDADRIVLYVGRFVEAKGLRELVTAFGALLARDPRRRLVLLGDGVMRAALEQLLRDSGIAARTTLPGACEPAGVAQWLAACDVLTLPSWSEGYPNVVVEAVACGRPVVATDVGGTREILDADNGILVPPRDAAALERALEDALTRAWDGAAMAARMRRGWDDVARETLAVCESVLAARGR